MDMDRKYDTDLAQISFVKVPVQFTLAGSELML